MDNSPLPPRSALNEEEVEVVVDALREKARLDKAARISLDKLDVEHDTVFKRAINNILATELAIFTYAQIIDGLPTEEVAWDRRMPGISGDHPIDKHEELCPGALEKARELCKAWDSEILRFNPQLVKEFQKAKPGSKAFETRLIELVSITLHQFGVLLYQLDFHLHKGDINSVVRYTPPPDPESPTGYVPPPPPTLFSHQAFLEDSIYPEGVADIVGYWAEDRIIGGVVVFDREAERKADAEHLPPPNVYFYAGREKVTFRPFQLRDDQQRALVDFLLSRNEDPEASEEKASSSRLKSPFPILGDDGNMVRVDMHKAVTKGIYRDIWERRPPSIDTILFWGRRPKSDLDYPENRILLNNINAEAGLLRPKKRNRTD